MFQGVSRTLFALVEVSVRSVQAKRLMSLGMLRAVENLIYLNPLSSLRQKILAKYPAPELPQLSGGFGASELGISLFYNLAKIPQKEYYWQHCPGKGVTPVPSALPQRTSALSKGLGTLLEASSKR